MDNNFGYKIDLPENISEQLKKRAMLEKDLNAVGKVVPMGLVITLYQLSQEAWNKLRSQMSEMAEINKLLKQAVKNTYK